MVSREMVAVAALMVTVCGCIADPVVAGQDEDPPPASESPDIIVPAPSKPAPTTKRVVPLEVIKQKPAYDAGFPDANFVYEPPAEPDACARSEFLAEPLPVDLYVMLDRSGSMNIPQSLPPVVDGDCDVGDPTVSRWCYTLNALDGFFASGEKEETGAALKKERDERK